MRLGPFLLHALLLVVAAVLAMGTGLALAWASAGLNQVNEPDLLPIGRLMLLAVVLAASFGFMYSAYQYSGSLARLSSRKHTQDSMKTGGLLLVYSAVLGLAITMSTIKQAVMPAIAKA